MIPIDLDYLERQCKLQGGNVEIPSHVLADMIQAIRVLDKFKDHVDKDYTPLDDASISKVRSMDEIVNDTCGKFSTNPVGYRI